MTRPQFIRLEFLDHGAYVRAGLLWDAAPLTCAAICEALPVDGSSHHAIYSGSECVLLLPEVLRIDPENATSNVTRGQVAFTWMAGGSAYGVREDFAEICWFYDIDAEPRMWGGPVPVSIFATIEGSAEDFYRVCFKMRREGTQRLRVSVEGESS